MKYHCKHYYKSGMYNVEKKLTYIVAAMGENFPFRMMNSNHEKTTIKFNRKQNIWLIKELI